ncbi:replication initiator protein A [Lacticaseibacillus paracasei]|uniref:replication initiator protein A n=1 Tax=Lacticaseibacillus paracasei TaxID=1597 RepID=UPI0021A3FEBC|nr:replication initiator protein A [Lacticaseibacillus paracasei]MCT3316934.1 plasmid replication initiation protein [Lacticaseibacillus paracasei]
MTKSTDFNYYEANNVYGALFFQFPKVLMYGEQYKHLSSDAKLAYMVLKDRLEYSLRNNWVDEDGNIYFVYTNAELMELFNSSEKTVIKIKKELEGLNLLRQKRMGFQPKAGKQLPNRLYLAALNVQATDVYLRGEQSETPETLAARRTVNSTVQHDTVETLAARRTVNSTVQHDTVEKDAQTLAARRTVNSTVNLDKELKERDTNRYNIDTQKLDFSTSKFSQAEIENQNRDLVQNAADFYADPTTGGLFLEKEAIRLISFWVRTPAQMRRFMGIILNAKKDVEKDHQDIGVYIALDDPELQKLMTKTLRRYFNAIRSDEKRIKNPENYLYGAIQNLFGVWWNKQAAREYAAKHPEEQNTDNGRSWY